MSVGALYPRAVWRRLVHGAHGADAGHAKALERGIEPAAGDLVVGINKRKDVAGRVLCAAVAQFGDPTRIDREHFSSEPRCNGGGVVGRSIVDDDDLHLLRALGVAKDASQADSQTRGVVPDRNDERNAKVSRHRWCGGHPYRGGSPSVHSGVTPDGATLNTLYNFGMLVNIRMMNVA